MPGPSPKPTNLKILEGNPGKRPLPTNEPKPEMVLPACPAFLKRGARREWNRIAPELYQLGLLTRIDRAALAGYCQAYGRWEDAEKKLDDLSKKSPNQMQYLYKTVNGSLVISPLLCVANKAMEQMHKFLTEFGMTPASRSRIIVQKSEDKDPMSEFLAGRNN